LTILALGMGFYRLDAKSLWYDELVSVGNARLDLGQLWRVITTRDPNMSLYYVLLHFWVRIFGYTTTAIRSLSVVAGALTVPVTVVLGRRLFGRPVAAVAGLLLAISPFFIHYEQTKSPTIRV
jgi:mannosyltransferase